MTGTCSRTRCSAWSSNIWSVTGGVDGRRPTAEATPVTRGAQSVEGLALSADGRWLAFDSDRNGNHHIFTVPSDGGDAKQMTSATLDEFMPHWSPDAKEIAFHAFAKDLARRLEVVSVDGGTSSPVTRAPRNQRRPAWSPDGRAIVFDAGGSTASDVFLVEKTAAGGWGDARRLTSGSAARWSPDGHRILYVQPDGIWVTTRAGGAGRQVLRVEPGSTTHTRQRRMERRRPHDLFQALRWGRANELLVGVSGRWRTAPGRAARSRPQVS